MEKITTILVVMMLIAAASWLALKMLKKTPYSANSDDIEIGRMAFKLLQDMQEAEAIDRKDERIPRMLALIEERDRLINLKRQSDRNKLINEVEA